MQHTATALAVIEERHVIPIIGPELLKVETDTGAGILTASGSRDYAPEYVGRLALAKNYGESRIYRLGAAPRVPPACPT